NEHARDAVLVKFADQKSRLAVMKERVSQLTSSEAESLERKTKSDRKLADIRTELEWLQSEEAAMVYSDEEIVSETKKWSQKKKAGQQIIEQLKLERTENHGRLTNLEQELKEIQRLHKGFVEAVRISEVKATRLEVQIQNLLGQLETNYGMTLEKAAEFEL